VPAGVHRGFGDAVLGFGPGIERSMVGATSGYDDENDRCESRARDVHGGESKRIMVYVKPGDHPDFFRLAPPPGTSRESTIVLDREGRFWHDGALVEAGALADALHRWISLHPDDGRFILTNGYDWTYFRVELTPFFVRGVTGDAFPDLLLSDGTNERLAPETLRLDGGDALRCRVKSGRFEARFHRTAQLELAPWIAHDEPARLVIDGNAYQL
jgi:hypothetical protein